MQVFPKFEKQSAKKSILFILLFLLLAGCEQEEEEVERAEPVNIVNYDDFGIPIDSFNVESGIVKKNETLGEILSGSGIDYSQVNEIYTTSKPYFDFRKIQPQNNFSIYKNKDSTNSFYAFAYNISRTKYIVVHAEDSIKVDIVERSVEKVEKSVYGVINNSLYQTLIDQGSSIVLAGELAEVFAWQIDFYTIQKGDAFLAIYEELKIGDESIGIGNIIAAKFIHKNNTFNAFLFEQDDKYEYFDEEGKSLQKEFLKAPLKYRRISSGYSGRRLHPILRVYRPHRGIDYAAAIGTPVQSVGDGIVLSVGRKGPAGRMVKIRHNSVYSSAYLHLSGYAKNIRSGVKVKQGQVIGYVGSSGRSTGPHLDFRFWKNGSLVNYLTQKFPASKSVSDSNEAMFNVLKDSLLIRVDKLYQSQIASLGNVN
jgi:murein DD-endopeptidase MepM/ murein hydrolase activator NlpD